MLLNPNPKPQTLNPKPTHSLQDKDLGEVDRSELWVLARAARDSPVLEELRFAKAPFGFRV